MFDAFCCLVLLLLLLLLLVCNVLFCTSFDDATAIWCKLLASVFLLVFTLVLLLLFVFVMLSDN